MALTDLLACRKTTLPVEEWLHQTCDTVDVIVKDSPDSRAWYVSVGRQSFVAKWVEASAYPSRLAKDADICLRCLHPALVKLHNIVETADGFCLLFERSIGESLADPGVRERFLGLPVSGRIDALSMTFQALAAIVDAGWILVDFYDGSVLYDFNSARPTLIDFELFERGPGFVLEMDRNYGSSRLMAPEEFVRGEWIDEQTNVYTLGRFAICSLSSRIDSRWRDGFEGSSGMADVLARATEADRRRRFPSVRRFVDAFDGAAEP